MTLNVLEIATDVPPYKGGIARLVDVLIDGLRKRGWHVDVESPKRRVGEFKPNFIPFKKHEGYDVVHIHGPTPFLSDVCLLTKGNAIVYTHHAEICWMSERISQLYTRFHRFLACKRARAIVVHSIEYANLFSAANVKVVRPPVTLSLPKEYDLHDRHEKQFTVIFVGQFRAFKGINILIKAAYELRDVNFVLVGEGPLKAKFKHMVERLHLRNVMFEENVDDYRLQRLYEQAHVVCLPSLNTTEAYGLVLVEGALYGCVPIASSLIGVRENTNLLGGFSFAKGSSEQLVEIIRSLKNDINLWQHFSKQTYERANEYARKYNVDHYVQAHIDLFNSIAKTFD
ncbi:MAG: glycosyltransferase family 4 protein [Candidatus Bathyarchaeia archaeon]